MRMRNTAPVDDDFPRMMDDFDRELDNTRIFLDESSEQKSSDLTFEALNETNTERCEDVFHTINHWSPTDWACAFAGEAGEVCNAVKKLRRLDDGTNTAKDPQTAEEAIQAIAMELADTIIYADLLATRLGIDLSKAIIQKFNIVSIRMGSDLKL